LVAIGRSHSARKQPCLVGDRACMGQILVRHNLQTPFVPRPLLAHRVDSLRCDTSAASKA
jgi:hypothetical protein